MPIGPTNSKHVYDHNITHIFGVTKHSYFTIRAGMVQKRLVQWSLNQEHSTLLNYKWQMQGPEIRMSTACHAGQTT